jgi:hypothetical protein
MYVRVWHTGGLFIKPGSQLSSVSLCINSAYNVCALYINSLPKQRTYSENYSVFQTAPNERPFIDLFSSPVHRLGYVEGWKG